MTTAGKKKHIQCVLSVEEANSFMSLARDLEVTQQTLLALIVKEAIPIKRKELNDGKAKKIKEGLSDKPGNADN